MTEIVEVVEIKKNGIIEVSCPKTTCKNCSGGMFCNVKGKTFEAVSDKSMDIKVGDIVELFLPPARTISSTFITLMIPLLMFPLFYILIPSEKELFNFLYGILGIILGFVGVGIYFKISKHKYYPKITKIFDK